MKGLGLGPLEVLEAECQSGYTPSLAELTCTAGVLSPETFTCNAQPCKLPRVPNQAASASKR